MSSKNRKESAAAAQGEVPHNLSLVEDIEVADAENNEVGEDSDYQGNLENDMGIKVTDKRRVIPVNDETADVQALEPASAPDESGVYTIDLDEMARAAREAGILKLTLKHVEDKLKDSEAKLLEANKAVEEYADRFRKAQVQLKVETDEMRTRLQRNFQQKLEIARGDVVLSLLDTLDNLQRAIGAADAANEQGPAFLALRDGVRATAEIFESRLRKMGLEAVESEGQVFNPEVHEAVEIAPANSEDDNMVLAELQRGYKFGERLLRPACVRVGRSS